MSSTVKFEEDSVRNYLDGCIRYWRGKKKEAILQKNDEEELIAMCYIDAFQSVRSSLFGETLPLGADRI